MPANSYEKPDYWSKKAFSEGYPARSVYKLQEIDEKFGMIKKIIPYWTSGQAPEAGLHFFCEKWKGRAGSFHAT